MALAHKVLGQVSPAATTLTDLYTVPSAAGTQAIVTNITVTNTTSGNIYFRIAVRPNGEALATKHYVVYDSGLTANSFAHFTMPITVDASDVISVYATATGLAFSAFGSEIS